MQFLALFGQHSSLLDCSTILCAEKVLTLYCSSDESLVCCISLHQGLAGSDPRLSTRRMSVLPQQTMKHKFVGY